MGKARKATGKHRLSKTRLGPNLPRVAKAWVGPN